MSSVTRFIRQIPVGTNYYNAAAVVTNPLTNGLVFEFAPSGSNYVGNYPTPFPSTTGGTMIACSAALANAISAAVNASPSGAEKLVLRDMGKTLFAPTSAAGTSFGYFRQVQLINPNVISTTQGFNGGVNGSTFGVLGAANTPDAFTNYLTFYIPVTVAGVKGAQVNTQAFVLAGGQM